MCNKMSEIKVCRVCLAKEVKMYNMNDFQLKVYYEEIMIKKVNDPLPDNFCYECAAMLYKFHEFRKKCHIGLQALTELKRKGPITLDSITPAERKKRNLLTNINILSETKRLQSSTVIHNDNDHDDDDLLNETESEPGETNDAEKENKYDNNVEGDTTECSDDVDITEFRETVQKLMKMTQTNKIYNFEQSDTECEKVFDDSPLVIVVGDTLKDHLKETTKPNVKNKTNVEDKTNSNVVRKTVPRLKKVKSKIRKPLYLKSAPSLDPRYWLRIILNDKEAAKNFKLRAKDPKYVKALYKCELCLLAISSAEVMDRHMKLHHTESRGAYICQFCKKRFKFQRVLRKHATQHYNKYQCLQCNRAFQSLHTARNHNILHSGVILPCKHCGMEFRHKSSYYSHLRMYHRSEHVCPLCGQAFVSSIGLRQHQQRKHDGNAETNREEVEDQSTYCERCEIVFETEDAYHEHLQQSARHADDFVSNDEMDQLETSKTTASLKGGPTKTFVQSSISRRTTCTLCDKIFPSYSRFRLHHRAEHKGMSLGIHKSQDATQICEVCGLTVKNGTIRQHMNLHTKEEQFSCQICGEEFFHKNSLKKHQLLHREEQVHKFPVCDKQFKRRASMKLHHQKHFEEPYPKRIKRKEKRRSEEEETTSDSSAEYLHIEY